EIACQARSQPVVPRLMPIADVHLKMGPAVVLEKHVTPPAARARLVTRIGYVTPSARHDVPFGQALPSRSRTYRRSRNRGLYRPSQTESVFRRTRMAADNAAFLSAMPPASRNASGGNGSGKLASRRRGILPPK